MAMEKPDHGLLQVDILTQDQNMLPVRYLPNPFRLKGIDTVVPEGLSVSEIVALTSQGLNHNSLIVICNDRMIPREQWGTYKPYVGEILTVRAVPMGGGNTLRTVLSLAVIAATVVYAPELGPLVAEGLFGATAAAFSSWAIPLGIAMTGMAISAVGMLAVNAICPPAQATTPSLSMPSFGAISMGASGAASRSGGSALERSPSISGAGNQSNKYGVVPRVLGKAKITPPYGAEPYTEIAGDDQYLRLLFCLGYGPLEVTSLKIGDTLLSEFEGVESEIKQGYSTDTALTLFSDDVEEESLSIELTAAGGYSQRTTSLDTNEISLDFVFPSGLLERKTSYSQGEDPESAVTVVIEYGYSLHGAGSWTTSTLSTTGKSGKTIRRNVRISGLTSGQYDVRVKRTTADNASSYVADDSYWATLRSIHSNTPITDTSGLALVAVRIKASDQLNGVVDTFNCICSSVVNDWDGATWAEAETNNPASLFRAVLQGSANKRALADAEIDLTSLQSWHEFCSANGFVYNQVIDFQSSVSDILDEIAAAGRASKTYVDGKYGVIWDRVQTTPRQHFSPRNSWGFSSKKKFPDLPHGFRVRFANAAKDYKEDERIVYDDGYSSANATKFEQLALPGVTDSDLAWKHARYHIACARLQMEEYSWYADFEHIVCTRGDLIRVAHDVPMWGSGWGRVKTVTDDGTNATACTMDETLTMESGKNYCIRFRKATGATLVANVATVPGDTASFTFTTPMLIADGPAVGDIGLFGVVNSESVRLLVKGIVPAEDLTAQITAVDYNPAIYTADTGTIPEFNSQITLPVDSVKTIGSPIVASIRSDESVLVRGTDGVYHARIAVSFEYRSGLLFDQITETQVEYRLTGYNHPWERITYLNYVPEMSIINIDEGQSYDIRFRYKIADGRVSAWSTTFSHTVVGKTSPPPDVTTLWAEGNIIRWTYPTIPLDFYGFRVRHRAGTGTSWDDATPAHDDVIKGTTFSLDALPKGTRTILVKGEDVAGNKSTNAAILVRDLGDPTIDNVVVTEDYAAAGFPGTIVGGTVDGTDLKADSPTPFWPPNDTATFWDADLTATFWDAYYLEMSYLVEYAPAITDLPADISLDYTVAGSPYEVLYRTGGDSLFWEIPDTAVFWGADADDFWPAEGDFETWPGKLAATRQKYEFKIVTGPGTVQGVIYDFAVQLDVPDIEEAFEDVAIGATGTRLTLTETYRAISNVQVTVQDDGGSGIYAKVIDKSTTGPLIKVYNSSGSLTTGTIDAVVKGY